MRPLTRADIELDLAAYGARRDDARRAAIEVKKRRRVHVGDVVTLLFENFATLRHQVQEMVYAERIADPGKLDEELETYNPLMPTDTELSATMFLEMPDMATLKRELPRLAGIEHAVSLTVGGEVVKAVGEGGRSRDDYTATVHYLRFPLTESARAGLLDPAVPVELAVDHPAYGDAAALPPAVRESLIADLA